MSTHPLDIGEQVHVKMVRIEVEAEKADTEIEVRSLRKKLHST